MSGSIIDNPYHHRLIVNSAWEAGDLQVRSDLISEIMGAIEIMGWDDLDISRNLGVSIDVVRRVGGLSELSRYTLIDALSERSRYTLAEILAEADSWLAQELGDFE